MSREEIMAILDKVRAWPEERQADAARMLREMEAHSGSPLQLSDKDAVEVRRRMMSSDRKTIPAEQVFERFRPSDLRRTVTR